VGENPDVGSLGGGVSWTAVATIGRFLRRERERRALSLEEVSDRTRIPVRSLELIENDRLEELPGATVTRGFIRSYAQVLGADAAPLLSRLDGGHAPPPLTPALNTAVTRTPPRRIRVGGALAVLLALAALLVVLTLALALFLWQGRSDGSPFELSGAAAGAATERT